METRIALRAQKSQCRRQPNLAIEVQKFSEDTFPEAPAEESSKKSQTTRSTESEVQRATNEQSRVAEVTKIETSKINHEVVNVTRSKTSESQQEVQLRSSTEDKS